MKMRLYRDYNDDSFPALFKYLKKNDDNNLLMISPLTLKFLALSTAPKTVKQVKS